MFRELLRLLMRNVLKQILRWYVVISRKYCAFYENFDQFLIKHNIISGKNSQIAIILSESARFLLSEYPYSVCGLAPVCKIEQFENSMISCIFYAYFDSHQIFDYKMNINESDSKELRVIREISLILATEECASIWTIALCGVVP